MRALHSDRFARFVEFAMNEMAKTKEICGLPVFPSFQGTQIRQKVLTVNKVRVIKDLQVKLKQKLDEKDQMSDEIVPKEEHKKLLEEIDELEKQIKNIDEEPIEETDLYAAGQMTITQPEQWTFQARYFPKLQPNEVEEKMKDYMAIQNEDWVENKTCHKFLGDFAKVEGEHTRIYEDLENKGAVLCSKRESEKEKGTYDLSLCIVVYGGEEYEFDRKLWIAFLAKARILTTDPRGNGIYFETLMM